MAFRPFIDRASNVPLGVQLKGQVEYAIACGDLAPGAKLPTVRSLAEQLGVSPVTVSQVYHELHMDGVVLARTGRGTFVTDALGVDVGADEDRRLEALMERVAQEGRRLGLDDATLRQRFSEHLARGGDASRLITVIVVGVFEAATQGYAETLQTELGGAVRVRATTFDVLPETANALADEADLLVTLPYRVAELERWVGGAVPVTYLRFVPSPHTRVSLAEIDPTHRVLGVARLPGFLPALEAGIGRFAPHVARVAYCLVTDPHLRNMLAGADVVVYASGAERVRELLGAHERAFEFRHSPDPAFVEAHLLPVVRALRAGRPVPEALPAVLRGEDAPPDS